MDKHVAPHVNTVGGDLKPPYPMLAKTGKLSDLKDAIAKGYMIEPKLDGIRCLAMTHTMAGTQLYNRQLRNITASFPDVVDAINLKCDHKAQVVLDGEIYVRGDDGQPDFQLAQTRANRIRDVAMTARYYPASFTAFDLLNIPDSIAHWRLMERRRVLMDIAPQLAIATYSQDEANDLAAREVGEGLMLKHLSSRYDPGARSPAWLKVKWLHEVECYIGGVTFGIGKRERYFGGLLVGVPAAGTTQLRYIGTVGTGFTDDTLDFLVQRLPSLKTSTNPFTERGTDWDLDYFVAPALKIKVRFANYTREGIMRFPRFVGPIG